MSADTDFGELLALGRRSMPSVILLRRNHESSDQCNAVLAALVDVEDSLRAEAVVVITANRVRVRDLPIDS